MYQIKNKGAYHTCFGIKRRLKLISAMFFMTGLFLLAGCNSNAQADGESQHSSEPIKIAFIPMNQQVNLNNQEMKSNRSYQKQQAEMSKSS